MKISKDTIVTDIYRSHEKRIGTLELILRGSLLLLIARSILRIIAEKLYNLSENG